MRKETLCILVCMLLIIPGFVSFTTAYPVLPASTTKSSDDGTEYWALLVGVNEFKNHPYMTSTALGNDLAAKDFNNVLLNSDHWKPDHIRVLTGKNATLFNILKNFRWMHRMADEDDICLFYIKDHGSPSPDIFPYDEGEQGTDTVLYAYDTYRWQIGEWYICLPRKTHYLFDDQINTWLSHLKCKGACVIIDACFAGGVNDLPQQTTTVETRTGWMNQLGTKLSGPGRVVLMVCESDKLSNGPFFSYYTMEGLQGFGDTDGDGCCSAEEAFAYSSPRTTEFLQKEYNFNQHPLIFDNYPGDLIITDNELPPSLTECTDGSLTGFVNTAQTYSFNATDPESNQIKYYFTWGDESDVWTSLTPSGQAVTVNHAWDKEGTYNIYCRNFDEYGMFNFEEAYPRQRVVVTMQNDHIADQRQTELYRGYSFNYGAFEKRIYAQSFVPTLSTLSKIELEIVAKGDVQPITVYIRDNLTGMNLAQSSVLIKPGNEYKPVLNWTTFDFDDISVTPGKTYYVVCQTIYSNTSLYGWSYAGAEYPDPYPNGEAYGSKNNGVTWINLNGYVNDYSFVTYGI